MTQRWLLTISFLSIALASSVSHAQRLIPRIINGVPTDGFESVGIVGGRQFGGFCTGTLISPVHVLTAAHCAEFIGGHSNGTFEIAGQIYATIQIYIYPGYNSLTLANDIAILELSEPVVDVVPSPIFRGMPVTGDELVIVGFGAGGDATSGGDGSFGVKMVGTTTADAVTETLIIWIFDDIRESNTGAGDSGGPGFLELEGEYFVASVTSAGTEPDAGLGDVAFNTRVDVFADWIDEVVAAAVVGIDEEPVMIVDQKPETGTDEEPVDSETDGEEEDLESDDEDTPAAEDDEKEDDKNEGAVSCRPGHGSRPIHGYRNGHRHRPGQRGPWNIKRPGPPHGRQPAVRPSLASPARTVRDDKPSATGRVSYTTTGGSRVKSNIRRTSRSRR